MRKIILKTDVNCAHCVKRIEPVLKSEAGIIDYSIDLENPDKLVTIFSEGVNVDLLIGKFKNAGFCANRI